MSLARKILLFPLVRAVVALVVLGAVAGLLVAFLRAAGLDRVGALTELAAALAALAGLAFVVRVIERRPFFATLLPARGALRDLALGFGVGALLISTSIAALAVSGAYRVTGLDAPTGGAAALALLRATGFFLLVAVFEETLFRGIVFRFMEDGLGTWAALAGSALIFGLVHLSAPGATPGAAIAIALEAGVLLSALFLLRRTLWAAIGAHWAWNLFEGPVFGATVSGHRAHGLLQATFTGPDVWTGGAFGPEAGLACIVVCTVAGAAFTVSAARRGRVMAPMWRRARTPG